MATLDRGEGVSSQNPARPHRRWSEAPVHRVGLVGGTGAEGRALATRLLSRGVNVVIGSRNPDKATAVAAAIETPAPFDAGPAALGATNLVAAREAVVLLCMPYAAQSSTLTELAPVLAGALVITCIVPLHPPPRLGEVRSVTGGSAAEEAQVLLPDSTIVGAFHNVAAPRLRRPDADVGCDVLVTGDDPRAKAVVTKLIEAMALTAVDAGPLANSRVTEGLTAVLLYVNQHSGARHAGVRITHRAEMPPGHT